MISDKKKIFLVLIIMITLFAMPMTFANDSLDNTTIESENNDILSYDDYGRIEVENEEIEIDEGETVTITGTVYWYDDMECYDELNIEYSYVNSNGDLITDVTHYDPSYYGLSIDIKDLKANNSPYYVTLKPVEDDLYDDFLMYSDGINPVTITITVINPNALIDATLPEYDSFTPVGELYVSQDRGDDENDGSDQYPFKTIQKALDYNKELGGNYEIIVENGEYDFDDSYRISNNVRITGKGKVTIRGYTGTYILFTSGANTIELNNLTITGGKAAAISGSSTMNGLGELVNEGVLNIINCTFEENEGQVGAVITYSKTTILNTVFKNNVVNSYNNEWQGLVSARDQSLTMNYCTFLDNTIKAGTPIIYSSVKSNVNFNFWGDNNGPKSTDVNSGVKVYNWVAVQPSINENEVLTYVKYNLTIQNKYTNGNGTFIDLNIPMPEIQYTVKTTIGNSNPNTVNITTKENVSYNSNERGLEKVSVLLNNVELSSITFNVNANTIDRIYVSTTGSDTAIGDRNNPLKTIKAAIKRNNENGGDKVIILLPGTYNENNLEINDIVTIIGETENTIISDGNTVFIIKNDTQLYNLTFTNSNIAISHTSGNLSVFTCKFENNQKAVISSNSNLLLSDTQFTNNNETVITDSDTIINKCEFKNNNGIIILKSANITNSSFNNNERGIYVNNTDYTVLINNNTFKASIDGAIYVNKSSVIISNNIFAENGGAIYINQISDDSIINNTFINDTIYLKDANVNLKNNTNTSIFTENSCISNIILKFLNNETVKVKGGEIELNASVSDDMGNLITGGTVTFTVDGTAIGDASIVNGSATIKTSVSDGEYVISGSYTDCDNSISINDGFLRVNVKNYWFINETGYETIIEAVADAGINDIIKGIPGTYVQEQVQIGHRTRPDEPWVINKNITITSLTDEPIIFNATGKNIFNIDYYSNVTFVNILFTGANNPNGWGGAIHSMGKNTINITNCTFIDNYAYDGAAIHSWGNLYVTNCDFINNEAGVYGGAIYKDGDGDFIIENSRFINNTAYTYAGAVYTMGYSEVIQIFKNITFDGNDATCGGAVFTQGKNVTFIDCNFTNNKAVEKGSGYDPLGGALYAHYGATRFININFINNYAEGNGGALELDNSVLSTLDSEGRHLSIYWATFENCTIENNTALGYGTIFSGGIFTIKNYVNITNTVIKNNKAGDAALLVNLYGFYTLDNVTVENNINTNGNTLIYTYGVYSYPESFYANTTIINSKFINNKDEIIINTTTEYSTVRITDSTFENEGIILISDESVAYLTNVSEINPSNNYSIKNYGELSLENNTFTNPIYNNGNITTATYVIAINNSTIIEERGRTIQIESVVTDDNNNSIIGGSVVFIINNTQIPAVLETDHYIGNYTVLEGNQTVLSVYDDFGLLNLTIKNGIIIGRLIILPNVTTSDINVGDDAVFTVTLPNDATGNITLYINNKTYNSTLLNGTATICIPDLEFGKYEANITYFGDNKYNQTKTNASINVTKAESYIIINASDILIDEIAIINITVPGDATGDIILTINNKDYYSNIVNGKGSVEIENLKAGIYNIEATYNGNEKYLISVNNTSFNVNKKEISINSTLNGRLLTITVDKEDATGNITVISESKNYTGILENSAVTINITEESGNHELHIKYSGDEKYKSCEIITNITLENSTTNTTGNTTSEDNTTNTTDNSSVKVKTIITAENLEFYYQDGAKFIVKLTDEKNNPLANQNITIFINGVNINKTTDSKGIISLDIGLKPKLYPVAVSYNGNGNYNSCENMSNISVLSKIRLDKNKDIIKDYLDSTKYKVRVLDKYGKAVGAGEVVKLTINNKIYTVKTKSNGYVTLDIKLKPKTYTITVEYGNYSVKNKIVVKQVLKAKNTSKKKAKKISYKATLKTSKGKAIKNKKITFRINGKTYSAKTNKKGVATVQFKNLKVAKYIVKITYVKTSIKKTLKIKK